MSFWRKQVIQPTLDRDVDTAIAEQRIILERDPRNPQAHFALGALHYSRGEAERAMAFYRKAIELDPMYAAPHVTLGRIYAVRGRYELAWKHAREAERLGDRSLVDQLGRYPNVK
jgi:tetratricopeptide (TPR) repeat protein